MVKRGRHAADDGSFGRSSGMAAGRGAALLAVAVVIGIVLLNAADDEPSRQVTAGDDVSTSTSSPETTSSLPGTTSTTLAARAPKEVKVLSANGTDVKGAARKATDALRAAGFNVLAPVDAGTSVTATTVYFAAGFEREAQAVASSLGLGVAAVKAMPTPPPVPDIRGANVVVIVGPETAARLTTSTPGTPAATTATTKAGGATASSTTSTTRA
ncbi:MAG TPA: LytR C-terminal domain-containing protein [Acidimicrobiales bacterium]|nr:LytR C-terminal domain-containing protein [Acidimicrobiales bacterium]